MQAVRIVFEGQTTKGLTLQLRYPRPDDVQSLCDYINRLSKELTFLIFQGEEISYTDEAAWLTAKLDRIAQKKSVMLLAVQSSQLIGAAEVDMLEGVKRHTGGFGISVAQAYRERGVGELLMTTVIEQALAELADLEIITLDVFGNNPVAINLYSKLGFTEFAPIPNGIIHRNVRVDAVYMYRSCPGRTLDQKKRISFRSFFLIYTDQQCKLRWGLNWSHQDTLAASVHCNSLRISWEIRQNCC